MSGKVFSSKTTLLRSYPKNIFCLESLWDNNVETKLTVMPILELTATTLGIKYIHLSCNTLSEFKFSLNFLHKRKSYQILYLAFHGTTENLHLGDDSYISLEELADFMKGRFSDLIVHFGTCSTMNVSPPVLSSFADKAGIRLLSGYPKDVSWLESAAMDLLYFAALQNYKNPTYLNRFLKKNYPDLIKLTGFRTYAA